MPVPEYIKTKDEYVYYNGDGEFLLFIPEIYFERAIAVIEGEFIETLGICNYSVIKKGQTTDIAKNLRTFYFPSKFVTKPGKVDKVKKFTITKDFTADYRILHYENNGHDHIIESTSVPQDIDNVDDFFRLFVETANTPNTINYYDIYKYYIDSMAVNGFSYNLNIGAFGALVSEMYRDPHDINKPFRLGSTIDKDPYSYKPVSIKQLPKLVSPFSSLTSENFNEAVVGAIMNENNTPSPLEKVLVG